MTDVNNNDITINLNENQPENLVEENAVDDISYTTIFLWILKEYLPKIFNYKFYNNEFKRISSDKDNLLKIRCYCGFFLMMIMYGVHKKYLDDSHDIEWPILNEHTGIRNYYSDHDNIEVAKFFDKNFLGKLMNPVDIFINLILSGINFTITNDHLSKPGYFGVFINLLLGCWEMYSLIDYFIQNDYTTYKDSSFILYAIITLINVMIINLIFNISIRSFSLAKNSLFLKVKKGILAKILYWPTITLYCILLISSILGWLYITIIGFGCISLGGLIFAPLNILMIVTLGFMFNYILFVLQFIVDIIADIVSYLKGYSLKCINYLKSKICIGDSNNTEEQTESQSFIDRENSILENFYKTDKVYRFIYALLLPLMMISLFSCQNIIFRLSGFTTKSIYTINVGPAYYSINYYSPKIMNILKFFRGWL